MVRVLAHVLPLLKDQLKQGRAGPLPALFRMGPSALDIKHTSTSVKSCVATERLALDALRCECANMATTTRPNGKVLEDQLSPAKLVLPSSLFFATSTVIMTHRSSGTLGLRLMVDVGGKYYPPTS